MFDRKITKLLALLPLLIGTQLGHAESRSAVVDCRAGCHHNVKGCQESVHQLARLDAPSGHSFDLSSLQITARSNASDSPGLKQDPDWRIEPLRTDGPNPTAIIIRPIVSSCEGNSPHTQGVTFYTWTADYYPLDQTPAHSRSSDASSSRLNTGNGMHTGVPAPNCVVANMVGTNVQKWYNRCDRSVWVSFMLRCSSGGTAPLGMPFAANQLQDVPLPMSQCRVTDGYSFTFGVESQYYR